jgi:hypothetical protein
MPNNLAAYSGDVPYFLHSHLAQLKTLQKAISTTHLIKLRKAWLSGFLAGADITVVSTGRLFGEWQEEDGLRGMAFYPRDAAEEAKLIAYVGDYKVKKVALQIRQGGFWSKKGWVAGNVFRKKDEVEQGGLATAAHLKKNEDEGAAAASEAHVKDSADRNLESTDIEAKRSNERTARRYGCMLPSHMDAYLSSTSTPSSPVAAETAAEDNMHSMSRNPKFRPITKK